MKKLFFIFSFLLSLNNIYGRIGWSFSEFSGYYGLVSNFNNHSLHSFELMYDKGLRACTRKPFYYGISLTNNFNSNINEFGLKFSVNPTRRMLALTRRIRIYPYGFLQGNKTILKLDKNRNTDYNYKSGVGLNGQHYLGGKIKIRTIIQFGYIFNDDYLSNNEKLFVDLKLGFSISSRGLFKRNKTTSETSVE